MVYTKLLRIGAGEISSVVFVTFYTELNAHHTGKKFIRDPRYIDCIERRTLHRNDV